MLKAELINRIDFTGAITGMRYPYKSTGKSDSFDIYNEIGPDDYALATKLIHSNGDAHAKFLRMIHVTCSIQAPLYWWKEMDQYKVATTTNSESTMHTLAKKNLTIDDFSIPYCPRNNDLCKQANLYIIDKFTNDINTCNFIIDRLRQLDREKEKEIYDFYWYWLIVYLPESYNQTRMWDGDYQTLRNIYHARKGHPLKEWQQFREFIETLPYSSFITDLEKTTDDNMKEGGETHE